MLYRTNGNAINHHRRTSTHEKTLRLKLRTTITAITTTTTTTTTQLGALVIAVVVVLRPWLNLDFNHFILF